MSADWMLVLAGVEQALVHAIASIDARERNLAAPLAPSTRSLDFSRLEEGMARLAGCHLPTEQRLAQIDADLGAGEEAARQWLVHADAARKQLATWAGRAVG